MAPYDSAYLLQLLKQYAGRPTADVITDAQYYQRLSDAQMEIVADIAGIFPDCLYPTVAYGSIPTLTTTDNQNYTFGTDANGYALAPMGSVGIYRSLNDSPSSPMVPGFDYIPLGATMIQAPDNGVLPSVLYWRGISPPGTIDGSNAPVLFPEGARELIAIRAAMTFASEGNRNANVYSLMSTRYGYPLAQNAGRFAWWMQTWRTQFAGGGALRSYSGLALAAGSSVNLLGSY